MWGKKPKWIIRVWVREPGAGDAVKSVDLLDVFDDLKRAGSVAGMICSDGFVDVPFSDEKAECHRSYPASSILAIDILKK